jgi:hypothetical protein
MVRGEHSLVDPTLGQPPACFGANCDTNALSEAVGVMAAHNLPGLLLFGCDAVEMGIVWTIEPIS